MIVFFLIWGISILISLGIFWFLNRSEPDSWSMRDLTIGEILGFFVLFVLAAPGGAVLMLFILSVRIVDEPYWIKFWKYKPFAKKDEDDK